MVLLLLHGTGGDENDLLGLGRELSSGAALLSPRGRALESGMPRFFRRKAEGVFDVEDLFLRTHELAGFVKLASAYYHFDVSSVVAVGYSNGANIASSLLLLHPKLFAAAILFRPMVPFVPEKLPDLSEVKVLISAGLADQIIDRGQTTRLYDLLRGCNALATLHWEDAGHGLVGGDVQFAKEWLGRMGNSLRS